jgi:hypothetical protein
MYITLFHRGDRLGANITTYIVQIIYAIKHHLYINYSRDELNYNQSIFVKALFDFIDKHNRYLTKDGDRVVWNNTGDWVYTVSNVTKDIKCDLVSFFREHVFSSIQINFYSFAIQAGYSIPFDCKKTILIHLRLDDVSGTSDYDGRVCANYYKAKIEANEVCICECLENNKYNQQAPIMSYKLEEQIKKIRTVYKDHQVRIITSPGSTTDLPYECIRSQDASYDLFLLSMCDIIILSRSTYALSALFFGNYTEAYVPLWGHAVCTGLYTKYDRTNLTYFY